jgi:hypothetical protein
MKTVVISKVEVDAKGWLRLYPATEQYGHIYRAAAGVEWDRSGGFLHAEEPGAWQYSTCFRQILSAVESEYGDSLILGPATQWLNVPSEVRAQIQVSS